MNNNFICSLFLFFAPSLIASEHSQDIYDKKIEVQIKQDLHSSQKSEIDKYEVIGEHKLLTFKDLDVLKINNKSVNMFGVRSIWSVVGSTTEIEAFETYQGIPTDRCDILVSMDSENGTLLCSKIQSAYYKSKKNNISKDSFYVHFLKKPDNSGIISLKFTDDQVRQFIEKPSSTHPILKILGLAGLIALIYYFHPKYMALLGRA